MERKTKKEIIEDLLAKGDTMLCIDSRHSSIQVPDEHCGKVDLRLILNLNFRHTISLLNDGIEAELLFSGTPHRCWIPYESLWSAYNPQTGEGFLWPGQLPQELHDLFNDDKNDMKKIKEQPQLVFDQGKKTPRPTDKPRPALRVIPGGKK